MINLVATMKTKIFSAREVEKAAALIIKGEVVAFPTETVYGLGANAFSPEAVKKIFIAKGRPSDNPLIVHIAKKEQLNEVAVVENKALIEKLIEQFWPGPLTIVLKKKKVVPDIVTAGLKTVAVRMPNNKIALKLIETAKVPIAAPSANISGKPSGTCFKHVYEDFNGKIAGIIKGKCHIGLESTVVDLTAKNPVLLRPGGISIEELKQVVQNIKLQRKKTKKPKSPGMKYKHYAPNAKVILFENPKKMESYINKLKNKKVRIIIPEKTLQFSKNLFKLFRKYDKENVEYILIPQIDEKGIGLAIMDRIRRAASEVVK